MKILVIPGSLRTGSYNKLLARHAVKYAPEGIEIKYRDLNDIPMFNEDLEQNLPESVKTLLEDVKDASGIIISTPEYNNTIPAPVGNLFHWLSRKYSKPFIVGKPLAIMGASDGGFGTVRAQNHLLLMVAIIGMKVNAKHRLPVSKAQNVFDEQGNMIDESVKEKLKNFVEEFVADCRG